MNGISNLTEGETDAAFTRSSSHPQRIMPIRSAGVKNRSARSVQPEAGLPTATGRLDSAEFLVKNQGNLSYRIFVE